MPLTANQKSFLQQQVSLWTGFKIDCELPPEFASLILGLSEANSPFCDAWGNKDYQHNPLFWSGQILEPVISQWIAQQAGQNKSKNKDYQALPIWPQGKKFAVCLTHDVDWISFNSLRAQIRHLKVCLRTTRQESGRNQAFLNSLATIANSLFRKIKKEDKTIVFEPWLELEDSLGFRSTFFFFPDRASRYHVYDGLYYQYQDRLTFQGKRIFVPDLMRKLEMHGWEVGLHGTFESFDNGEELKLQKEQIEKSLNREIVSTRQHYLHFDIKKTPLVQSKAGFKYDTSFGFNFLIGFRNGLAFPFFHYDLQSDEPIPILQIPLHIQDSALFNSIKLDTAPELAVRYLKEIIDKVEKINGCVTLSWHPNYYNDKQWPGWFRVYRELLTYIASRDAWVAPVREIGEWWNQRHRNLTG